MDEGNSIENHSNAWHVMFRHQSLPERILIAISATPNTLPPIFIPFLSVLSTSHSFAHVIDDLIRW